MFHPACTTRFANAARLAEAALLAVAAPLPAFAAGHDYALTVYAGRLTHNDWAESIIPASVDVANSYLIDAALSRTVAKSADLPITYELEGQVAKHFGIQHNWEFNLVADARWHRFPWNGTVRTTAAFGLGPSLASSLPKFEVAENGTSRRFLIYWFMEITLGPPDADWSVSLRLHHRSTAFGTFGDNGGYNALALGLRHQF